jgi:DNA replication protein DnaC
VERASTLITSQLPVTAWHEAIGDPTLADAICDRLIHTAQVIELRGPSMREVRAKAQRGGASAAAAAPASPKSAGWAGKGTP